jgi:hypothetical protein
MYWLGVLLIIILSIAAFMYMGSVSVFFDIPSILFVITIVVPLLIASGQMRSFLLALKISTGRVRKSPAGEVRKAIVSVNLAIKLLLVSGLIGFLSGSVAILTTLRDLSQIGPPAAVAIMTNLYALFMIAFLMPVRSKLEVFLIDQEGQN